MRSFMVSLIVCYCVSVIGLQTAIANEPVKIAVMDFTYESSLQRFAMISFKGVRLAVEKINRAGGILDHPLEVIEMRAATPLEAKEKALAIVAQEVVGVISTTISDCSFAMAPVFQEAHIPMIMSISTNPKITLVGDYIFRVCFTDPFQGVVMAQFALEDLHAKTAVVLKKSDSSYSLGLAETFQDAFRQEGGIILWEGQYLGKDIDFREQLNMVKQLQPDVVFVPGHSKDCDLLLQQAQSMGIQTSFLGGDGWGRIGAAASGHYFSHHWHPQTVTPISQAFVEQHRQQYGDEQVYAGAALAYDAMMVLADAIQRAQSVDPQQIRAALAMTKDFQGVTGTITFDEQGDPINKDAVILQFQQEESTYVKTISAHP